jgi:NADH-quinone oxidoreductase subunit E
MKECCGGAVDEFKFYEAQKIELPEEVQEFINKWRDKPGNLIMILHKVQEVYGYVPRQIAMKVAKELDQPLAKIYGVITFYHLFRLKAAGKHIIKVCTGTACYLKGADMIVEEVQHLLGINLGETTGDGRFTMEGVRCLGCCGLAPVMMIDDDVYGDVDKSKMADILGKYTE